MRQSAIAVFEPGKEAAEAETLWCPIVKGFFPKRTIVAAHLVPYSLSKGVTKYLFGNGAEARMNTPDNFLMIYEEVEIAMDNHRFVLIPENRNESPLNRWKIHVATDDARKKLLYPGKTLGDLDGS